MASRQIGSLWVRQSKSGISYMSGVLQDISGDIQIAIFKNDRKEKDNQPDYKIVLSEKKEERKTPSDPFLAPPAKEYAGEATPEEIATMDKENVANPIMSDEKTEDIDVAKIPF